MAHWEWPQWVMAGIFALDTAIKPTLVGRVRTRSEMAASVFDNLVVLVVLAAGGFWG